MLLHQMLGGRKKKDGNSAGTLEYIDSYYVICSTLTGFMQVACA